MSAKRIASLCPIEELLVLIGGCWKPVILWWLMSNTVRLRFTILRTKMPRISWNVLAQQLRELQRDALIKRQMFAEMPVRVEYSLTPLEGSCVRFSRRSIPGPEGTYRNGGTRHRSL